MIAYDLGLEVQRYTKTEVLFRLNALLLQNANRGKTTVLIIDEAHNLEWDVLEEVRLLSNLETRRGKLLQIILAGQPELDRKLDAPNLRQLKQRISLRYTLQPFSEKETIEYINTRLAKAGVPDQRIFPADVLAEIHVRSQGIPRVINAICDNCLLTAFALETKVVTMEILDEVTEDMRLDWPGKQSRLPREDMPHTSFNDTPFFVRED